MFACGILRRNYQQLISLRTCVENVFVRDFQGLLNPALKCSTYQLSTLAVGNELEEETSVLVAATADADVEHECVEVGVIGVPNAGKSTLVNAIVGSKVRSSFYLSIIDSLPLLTTPATITTMTNIHRSLLFLKRPTQQYKVD